MRFFHIFESDRKRAKGITVVAETSDTTGDSGEPQIQVECATSLCAPVEPNFSRPKGRTIALSRLTSGKEMPPFKRFSFRTNDQRGLKAQILERLSDTVPIDWAYSLVNRELARLREIQVEKTEAVATQDGAQALTPAQE